MAENRMLTGLSVGMEKEYVIIRNGAAGKA